MSDEDNFGTRIHVLPSEEDFRRESERSTEKNVGLQMYSVSNLLRLIAHFQSDIRSQVEYLNPNWANNKKKSPIDMRYTIRILMACRITFI
jgi:hypothetical protein